MPSQAVVLDILAYVVADVLWNTCLPFGPLGSISGLLGAWLTSFPVIVLKVFTNEVLSAKSSLKFFSGKCVGKRVTFVVNRSWLNKGLRFNHNGLLIRLLKFVLVTLISDLA